MSQTLQQLRCSTDSSSVAPDPHHGDHIDHENEAEELRPAHQIPRNFQGEELLSVLKNVSLFHASEFLRERFNKHQSHNLLSI